MMSPAKPQCAVNGCEKPVLARGWCSTHYQSWKKYGDPLKSTLRQADSTCAAKGCGTPAKTMGYCIKHYTRWRRNGDPLAVQYIRGDDLARFESYVDRSGGPDACHPWTGGQCAGGYGQINIKGKLELAHIMAWELEHGRPKPPGTDIDHECHNRAVRDGSCKPGICAHRLCCNGAHLADKSRRQHRDDTEQWVMPRGSRVGTAKLNEAEVREIRKLLAANIVPRNRIAALYGVSRRTVDRIGQGEAWAWLTE